MIWFSFFFFLFSGDRRQEKEATLTVISLLGGSEMRISRPSTVRWALETLDPATTEYSPLSDTRTVWIISR